MNRGGPVRDGDAVSVLAGTHGVVTGSAVSGYDARRSSLISDSVNRRASVI